MQENSRYISRRSRAWVEENLSELEKELKTSEEQLARSIDPGSWKQTSDVDHLRDRIQQLEADIKTRREVLNGGEEVDDGDEVAGVAIGTRVRVRYEGENETEEYELGTNWDAKRAKARRERPEVLSFDTPLAQAVRNARPGERRRITDHAEVTVEDIRVPERRRRDN